jgi:L-2-hydroxyglutarate oxidase
VAVAPGEVDLAVVGAGIVGLAVARELSARHPDRSVVVVERESRVGTQQTGRNSGVIHAGIYYAPGSLKARLCVAGARELYDYCEERGIPYERCGKLIVARHEGELGRLDELERRGRENGVPDLRRLSPGELRDVEPHCRGVAALHSPHTGIVDFAAVARAFAGDLAEREVPVVTSCGVEAVVPRASRGRPRAGGTVPGLDGRLVLRHNHGETRARFVVFCAGRESDRLAVAAGAPPDPRIVPFRGRYLYLRPERRELVRALIYPVPDPALPFLGVHLSRHVDGEVSLGPSALLWPRGPGDLVWPGTWRMARRWWRIGLSELRHAASRRAFAAAAADYVPELQPSDFRGGFSGVRAQALGRDGSLVDDFVVSETERALHVRNAPSPAATSVLALARLIADRADELSGAR